MTTENYTQTHTFIDALSTIFLAPNNNITSRHYSLWMNTPNICSTERSLSDDVCVVCVCVWDVRICLPSNFVYLMSWFLLACYCNWVQYIFVPYTNEGWKLEDDQEEKMAGQFEARIVDRADVLNIALDIIIGRCRALWKLTWNL